MGIKENDFLKHLQATFAIEADEHIRALTSGLLKMEKATEADEQKDIIETIFREAHSLKGAARAVNRTDIESICQSLESVFAALKRRELSLSPELSDTILDAVDTIEKLLTAPEEATSEKTPISTLIQQLDKLAENSGKGEIDTTLKPEISAEIKKEPAKPEPAPQVHIPPKVMSQVTPEKDSPPSVSESSESTNKISPSHTVRTTLTETIRISTAKLDSILLQVEEMLSAKLATKQRIADIKELLTILGLWKKELAKYRISDNEIPDLELNNSQTALHKLKLKEFLDWNQTRFKTFENKLSAIVMATNQDHRVLSGMVDNLLEDMKQVLMLPFSTLLEIFPKLVRDISRDQGKKVELEIMGENIEIDRRILEEMKDALIHLVRNCVDHGIEIPEERKQNQKALQGKISISVSQKDSSNIEILISDDGRGIDVEKVKSKILGLGLVSKEKADEFSQHEALSYIFKSDVSTSPIVTDISGRGIGLAIVREKVEKLGGVITVETRLHKGSSFRILLPVTLATFRGILVETSKQIFVVPTINVEQVARIRKNEIKTVEDRETIPLNGQAVSLVRLDEILELPRRDKKNENNDFIQILVLGSAENRIAFYVDETLDEQEVLVKNLGKQLSRVRNIAGATILGSGKVIPILNVSDLIKSAVLVSTGGIKSVSTVTAEEQVEKKSILVVEDSITARTLIKNIIESAGYEVKTAVDGVDAFTTLRTETFDLVVSDIEMPRMNGFELTSKIRNHRQLAETPVVLVTALESREDRERGIDVGANAYIVKKSFDQSNLLEVIRRLI